MVAKKSRELQSLICIEVGSVTTRAHFFDAVENGFRFLASGEAFSTAAFPMHDMHIGIMAAVDQLEELTGRSLVTQEGELRPLDNALGAVFSGLPPVRVVIIGLLEGVSLESARNLVGSTYCQIVGTFSLNDRQRPVQMIDIISQAMPDLVLVAGGIDRGASRAVLRLVESLALALQGLPEGRRPIVFYAGNNSLFADIDNLLGNLAQLHSTANIRPGLDLENLGPAAQKLNDLSYYIQGQKLPSLVRLIEETEGQIAPSSHGFGRIVRFLSTVIDPPKGVLGVDLGASHTTVAAAFSGEMDLKVYGDLGMGASLSGLLEQSHLEQITRWLPEEIPDNLVLDYLYNKTLHPATLPITHEELAIEQAAARQALRLATERSLAGLPHHAIYPLPGKLPWFDRILLSGSVLTRAPRPEQSLLIALDAIQPVGIATLILDQNDLSASLGLVAQLNPLMAVQVLESNSFLNLGTVVTPVGPMRKGFPVLRLQLVRAGNKGQVIDVMAGDLLTIPLSMGRAADVYLEPMHNADIGLGPGRGGWVRRVVGGVFGLIVDARGRPVQLPKTQVQRVETLQAWEQALIAG